MNTTHDEVDLGLVVSNRLDAADGVIFLELSRGDGAPLPEWAPGAHIDIVISPEMTRQYSLCGDPAERSTYSIAVLYEPDGRGGSRYIHEHLSVGDVVAARGPRNHFRLETSPHFIFIAGGIGVTPILPMVVAAEEAGASWSMVYGGRTRQSMAFAADLTTHHGEKVTIVPQDEAGLIDLASIVGTPRADTFVYACGPTSLLDAVTDRCLDAGWPSSAVRLERFSPKVIEDDSSPDAFEVELAESGLTLIVNPDQSILEVVRANGVDVMSSCAEGTCGSCETTVLNGEIEHRDSVLSEDEQEAMDTMMICVSRARCAKLVLEL